MERTLGATGLKVGPLGVAASYGAPAEAFEAAFEKGCNYFYLGSGRHKAGMRRAIRNFCRFLAMSGHQRSMFPRMAAAGQFDLFHVRYNAAHRGAEEDIFPHLQGDGRPRMVTYTATRWGQLLNPKKMPPGESVPAPSDCYRFALSNPAVDVCLCGPRNMDQMLEALPALDLGPLDEKDMERMGRIGDYVRSHNRTF
jgi:aryl-alcohol dehydrogenase-like predicted oxidoreductase